MTSKSTSEKPKTAPDKALKQHQEEINKLNRSQKEHGGQEGPDPTRYGDWEKGGRCTDF